MRTKIRLKLFLVEKPEEETSDIEDTDVRLKRSQIAEDLRDGKLEDEIVTVEVTEQHHLCLMHCKAAEWNRWV